MSKKASEEVPFGSVEPYKVRDFPVPLGVRAILGPAVLLASFGFGSGELIWWPYLTAKYGLYFVWLMIPAGLMQWWINQELARYVVITGESVWTSYVRISRAFSIIYWIFALITLAWWGGYAGAGGTALAALTNFPAGWTQKDQTNFWAILTIILSLAALTLSRTVHWIVEKVMLICIVVGAVGTIVVAFHPVVREAWPSFLSGLVTYRPMPPGWDPTDAATLITSIAFLGLGGFWQISYPTWMRAVGAGMAHYMPKLESPITGKPEAIPATGYVPSDTEGNRLKYRSWMKVVAANNTWGVCVNLFTTILMAFLAYAILHPRGIWPKGYKICVVQAHFWGEVWGTAGFMFFLFIAAMLIVDTYLVILDFVPRMYTDVLHTTFKSTRAKPYTWWYYVLVAFFSVWTAVTLFIAAPGELIIWGGVLNFLAWPIMHTAVIYVNYYKLPKIVKWLRPAIYWLIIGIIITTIYTYTAIWFIGVTFKFL